MGAEQAPTVQSWKSENINSSNGGFKWILENCKVNLIHPGSSKVELSHLPMGQKSPVLALLWTLADGRGAGLEKEIEINIKELSWQRDWKFPYLA